MIIDLGVGRRDQDAAIVTQAGEAWYSPCELLEHFIEHVGVAAINDVGFAQIEPQPSLGNGADDFLAGQAVEVALTPIPSVVGLRAHAEDVVVLTRIGFDQRCKRLAAKQWRLMQPVLEQDGLMTPQRRTVLVIEVSEDGPLGHDIGHVC